MMEKEYGHAENCKYSKEDKILYCLWQINPDDKILISAMEYSVFDIYLERINSEKIMIQDVEEIENLPYKIVYGIVMFQDREKMEQVKEMILGTKDYAYVDLEEDMVNISSYQDIVFGEEKDFGFGEIPFAALMQTKHEFPKDMPYSVTMFLRYGDMDILDNLVNRAYLLACRYAENIPDLTEENWKEYIDYQRMYEAAKIADLYTGE